MLKWNYSLGWTEFQSILLCFLHIVSWQVKRVPGSSGRLHKTEEGEWEWSDDECAEEGPQMQSQSSETSSKAASNQTAGTSSEASLVRPGLAYSNTAYTHSVIIRECLRIMGVKWDLILCM